MLLFVAFDADRFSIHKKNGRGSADRTLRHCIAFFLSSPNAAKMVSPARLGSKSSKTAPKINFSQDCALRALAASTQIRSRLHGYPDWSMDVVACPNVAGLYNSRSRGPFSGTLRRMRAPPNVLSWRDLALVEYRRTGPGPCPFAIGGCGKGGLGSCREMPCRTSAKTRLVSEQFMLYVERACSGL